MERKWSILEKKETWEKCCHMEATIRTVFESPSSWVNGFIRLVSLEGTWYQHRATDIFIPMEQKYLENQYRAEKRPERSAISINTRRMVWDYLKEEEAVQIIPYLPTSNMPKTFGAAGLGERCRHKKIFLKNGMVYDEEHKRIRSLQKNEEGTILQIYHVEEKYKRKDMESWNYDIYLWAKMGLTPSTLYTSKESWNTMQFLINNFNNIDFADFISPKENEKIEITAAASIQPETIVKQETIVNPESSTKHKTSFTPETSVTTSSSLETEDLVQSEAMEKTEETEQIEQTASLKEPESSRTFETLEEIKESESLEETKEPEISRKEKPEEVTKTLEKVEEMPKTSEIVEEVGESKKDLEKVETTETKETIEAKEIPTNLETINHFDTKAETVQETLENTEEIEKLESLEKSEVLEKSEALKESEASEALEESEVLKEVESLENIEFLGNSEIVENSEIIKDTEILKEPEILEQTDGETSKPLEEKSLKEEKIENPIYFEQVEEIEPLQQNDAKDVKETIEETFAPSPLEKVELQENMEPKVSIIMDSTETSDVSFDPEKEEFIQSEISEADEITEESKELENRESLEKMLSSAKSEIPEEIKPSMQVEIPEKTEVNKLEELEETKFFIKEETPKEHKISTKIENTENVKSFIPEEMPKEVESFTKMKSLENQAVFIKPETIKEPKILEKPSFDQPKNFVKSGSYSSESKETFVKLESFSSESKETFVKLESFSSEPEETLVKSESFSSEPEETLVKSESFSSKPEETSAKVKDFKNQNHSEAQNIIKKQENPIIQTNSPQGQKEQELPEKMEGMEAVEGQQGEEEVNENMEKIQTLLDCDKNRCRLEPYDKDILFDIIRGHWELFEAKEGEAIQSMVVQADEENSYENLIARDPKLDIREGVVGIDFGTKSTVVVRQDATNRIIPIRIGTGNLSDEVKEEDFENPTIIEFTNVKKFLEDYQKEAGRPHTSCNDIFVSYDAYEDFRNCKPDDFYAYFSELKQWANREKGSVLIKDKQKEEYYLGEHMGITEGIVNPIELYAYYIGLYINNMRNGIYLKYLMTFPVGYAKEVRDFIADSFCEGIKKSLPTSILNDPECMERFQVKLGISEPAAYAVTALEQSHLEPKDETEQFMYGIFDFGGGTTDFDFGICRGATEEEYEREAYDYVLECFGADSDVTLGGENILELLAYQVYQKNLEVFREKKITFTLPAGENSFAGSETLLINSQIARRNMSILKEELRPLWHQEQGWRKKYQLDNESSQNDVDKEGIVVSLYNMNGEPVPQCILEFSSQDLVEIIKKRIQKGIDSFFQCLIKMFLCKEKAKKEENKIYIFLAGNSSKSVFVKELFQKKIEEYYSRSKRMSEEMGNAYFELIDPLTGENSSKEDYVPNAKTGVAYGLLKSRPGSSIKIEKNYETDALQQSRFHYYLGRDHRHYFDCKFSPAEIEYKKWVPFQGATREVVRIYYTNNPIADSKIEQMPIENVPYKEIHIDIKEDALLFIRTVEPDLIEYVVAQGLEEISTGEIKKCYFN